MNKLSHDQEFLLMFLVKHPNQNITAMSGHMFSGDSNGRIEKLMKGIEEFGFSFVETPSSHGTYWHQYRLSEQSEKDFLLLLEFDPRMGEEIENRGVSNANH